MGGGKGGGLVSFLNGRLSVPIKPSFVAWEKKDGIPKSMTTPKESVGIAEFVIGGRCVRNDTDLIFLLPLSFLSHVSEKRGVQKRFCYSNSVACQE